MQPRCSLPLLRAKQNTKGREDGIHLSTAIILIITAIIMIVLVRVVPRPPRPNLPSARQNWCRICDPLNGFSPVGRCFKSWCGPAAGSGWPRPHAALPARIHNFLVPEWVTCFFFTYLFFLREDEDRDTSIAKFPWCCCNQLLTRAEQGN